MLRRRILLSWAVATTLAVGACSRFTPTEVRISQAEMAARLQGHFPKQYPVAGLLQLQLQQPALQLQPESNQLQAALILQLSGPALPQTYTGHLDVRFGLRYEPKDHSVRTQQVQIQSFQLEGLHTAMNHMLNTYSTRLVSQALEDLPLYTVPEAQLQRLRDRNLTLGAITVTTDGLQVAITPAASAER